jgi:hypothetical protein
MHKGDIARTIADYTYKTLYWGQNRVPRGIRSLIGLLFMVGGVFGFLPILGFWMLPLGAAFVAMDIPPARRHIDAWMRKLYRRAYREDPTSNQ